MGHKHPANRKVHDQATLGGRAADSVASFMGSWKFIGIQSGIIIAWITFNAIALFGLRWDPYPFILLNLLFSTQAAYAAPILQLAQNRQSEHDRLRAEHDYETNQEALDLIRAIHERQAGGQAN